MAQEDKTLVGELVRSIDKTLKWEITPGKEGGLHVTLRHSHGEAWTDLSDQQLSDALEDDGISRNVLREQIKRARRRIFTGDRPYMPWILPKIIPIGAPGPRGGGGGGWGGGGGGGGGRR
jgi:hypothetical protein